MNLIPNSQSTMSISPEIRDQAYQFFIEEAPELLQVLESGLLTLRQERSTAKVHDLMRAAHSLKGGAASVDLHAIKTIAHRLEDILKAFYSDDVVIDSTLESLLLRAYDCLRLPLMEQITTGYSDPEFSLDMALPIFEQLEAQLGAAMAQTENFIPSSSDLGIDMVLSIFDVDVGQGLERLTAVLANPQDYEVAGELRAQAEVFEGFAELLDLPGFGATAQATLKALDTQPDEAVLITQLALIDFQTARDAVLAGERGQVGGPSVKLVNLGEHQTAAALFDQASIAITNPIETAELDWEKIEPAGFSVNEAAFDQFGAALTNPIETAELNWEKVEPETFSVDEAAALEAFDALVENESDDWNLPQALDEEVHSAERGGADSTPEAERAMTSLEEEFSEDSIALIEDIFGHSDTPLTESGENLSASPAEIESLADRAIADPPGRVEDNRELTPKPEFPVESSTDFPQLDQIFGDLAAATETDAGL